MVEVGGTPSLTNLGVDGQGEYNFNLRVITIAVAHRSMSILTCATLEQMTKMSHHS
jgi:hypothetical protein